MYPCGEIRIREASALTREEYGLTARAERGGPVFRSRRPAPGSLYPFKISGLPYSLPNSMYSRSAAVTWPYLACVMI